MGILDALGSLTEAAVKTVLIPVAVVKDVVTLSPGENTAKQVKEVAEKVVESGDDLVS